MLQYLGNRLSEKSTWAALGMIATAIGWRLSPENWLLISNIGMGLGGLIAAGLPSTVQTKNISGAVTDIPSVLPNVPRE